MTLREKQSFFVKCLTQLFDFAESRGWEFTLGDGYRPDKQGHMKGSLHYIRLAQDLNLFIKGKWISDGDHEAWKELGDFWEHLDPLCTWGGRFQDANHFSVTHEGRR
jgi:hypothetical protein